MFPFAWHEPPTTGLRASVASAVLAVSSGAVAASRSFLVTGYVTERAEPCHRSLQLHAGTRPRPCGHAATLPASFFGTRSTMCQRSLLRQARAVSPLHRTLIPTRGPDLVTAIHPRGLQ
jgi:hypothetical protein